MWMNTRASFQIADAGGLHGVPLLGRALSIDTMPEMSWDEIDRPGAIYITRIILLDIVALLGFDFVGSTAARRPV